MGQQSRQDIIDEAARRKERIRGYMLEDPPRSLKDMGAKEGMHDRAIRGIAKVIEAEEGLDYFGTHSRPEIGAMPFGLTNATSRFRQKLGDHVYALRTRGNDSDEFGRNEVAPIVGINTRQQRAAENRPFTHDWTISQIERLARAHGRDPVEFMLTCLSS